MSVVTTAPVYRCDLCGAVGVGSAFPDPAKMRFVESGVIVQDGMPPGWAAIAVQMPSDAPYRVRHHADGHACAACTERFWANSEAVKRGESTRVE